MQRYFFASILPIHNLFRSAGKSSILNTKQVIRIKKGKRKMNKKELFKTSNQNGVTIYIDKGFLAVVDMDVEDWVTEI